MQNLVKREPSIDTSSIHKQFVKRLKLENDHKEDKPQQDDNYLPFAKRARSNEQNYAHIREAKKNELEKLASLKLNNEIEENDDDKDINIKTECFIDSNDILIYNNLDYNLFNYKYDSNLPIVSLKTNILEAIESNNITIIQGSTGCGKTTQIPQFILDKSAQDAQPCKIIITQPRRIAAKSISKRVSDEREWKWGTLCGYKVSMDSKFSKDTKIFYVTTGYLLEMNISNHNQIENYTHVILDEVHERDLDTDLLMLMVKILLAKKFKFKLILMSATLEQKLLVDYFKSVSLKNEIPIIKCESNLFDVDTYFLESIEEMLRFKTNIEFDFNKPSLFDEQLETVKLLLEYIDSKEKKYLTKDQDTIDGFPCNRGAVLIFVPGMEEILRVKNHLTKLEDSNRLQIHMLHSEIALEHQMKAFQRAKIGFRKVIISTSIAESSLTVPDIIFIIDFCLTKLPFTEPANNFTSLELEWASRSNIRQRRGRAGRVKKGACYHLITRKFYEKHIQKHPEPAIERNSIDKFILNLKRFCSNPPIDLLVHTLTPPSLDKIERTILFLKETGALSLYKNKKCSALDGDLTYAGRVMSNLPVDLKLGKLILLGYAFGRLKQAILIASALNSNKNIFLKNSNLRLGLEYYRKKFFFSNGQLSDFVCIINAYNLWMSHKKYSNFKHYQMEQWCEGHMLDLNRLIEMDKTRQDLEYRLKNLKFKFDSNDVKDIRDNENFDNINLDECLILNFIVAGGFYPNYFKTLPNENEDFIIRNLSGKNPRTTVLISGINNKNNKPILFDQKLVELFKSCSKYLIRSYDSQKAFIEFRNSYEIASRIEIGVYLSLLMCKIGKQLYLPVLDGNFSSIEKEIDHLKNLEAVKYSNSFTSRITIGDLNSEEDIFLLIKNLKEFQIKISHINELNCFWAQINTYQQQNVLHFINTTLKATSYKLKVIDRKNLSVGELVVCFHFTGHKVEFDYYRAKILDIKQDGVEVFYIDYGNKEIKDFDLLFELSENLKKIPYQAFQCQLAHLTIPQLVLQNKTRLDQAVKELATFLKSIQNLKISIFSVVNNIARVTLFNDEKSAKSDNSSNLIKLGLFEKCEEPALSKIKHSEFFRYQDSSIFSRSSLEWINLKSIDEPLSNLRFKKNEIFEIKAKSPIEVSASGLTYTSTREKYEFKTKVERDSINHVLLDDEPSFKCSNLIVAHKTSFIESSKEIVLRNNCLFPKLSGLVSLCLLAFSPEIELRVDFESKKYTGALCGLGYDPVLKRPLYIENDIEDTFEVEFDDSDIKKINKFRRLLNCLIGCKKESQRILANSNNELETFQTNCRNLVLALIKENRDLVNEKIYFKNQFRWNQIDENLFKEESLQDEKMFGKKRTDIVFFMPLKEIDFSKI